MSPHRNCPFHYLLSSTPERITREVRASQNSHLGTLRDCRGLNSRFRRLASGIRFEAQTHRKTVICPTLSSLSEPFLQFIPTRSSKFSGTDFYDGDKIFWFVPRTEFVWGNLFCASRKWLFLSGLLPKITRNVPKKQILIFAMGPVQPATWLVCHLSGHAHVPQLYLDPPTTRHEIKHADSCAPVAATWHDTHTHTHLLQIRCFRSFFLSVLSNVMMAVPTHMSPSLNAQRFAAHFSSPAFFRFVFFSSKS